LEQKKNMLKFYGKEFSSRLLIGSALYPSPKIMQDAIRAAGSQIVTVSVRRESAGGKTGDQFWSLIRELGVSVLPNTAGCKAYAKPSPRRSLRANCSTRRGSSSK
jgi:thiazole synthase